MNVFLIPSDSHQSEKTEEAKASASPLNSLLRLNGRTSLYWTAKALAESNYIRSICVICDKEFQDELRTELPQDSRFRFEELKELDAKQPDQQTPLNESIQAIEKVAREMVKTPTMVVFCTAPHWTGKTYNDVISHFRDSGADSALFYVKISDARMKTPFFKALIQVLQCAVIGPGAIDGFVAQVGRFSPEIQKLDAQSSARRSSKKPNTEQKTPTGVLLSVSFKLASMAGIVFLWRLLKRNLTPAQVEKKANQILKTNFRFIELSDENLHLRLSEPSHRDKIETLISRRWEKS